MFSFIKRNLNEIYNGGKNVLLNKLILFSYIPLFIFFFPFLILIRAISPFLIIRFGELITSRIGHLAANTELYLCEKDAGINKPTKKFIDIFYISQYPICNKFLLKKWKSILLVYPKIIIYPLHFLNKIIPGGDIHNIGTNSNQDRDINNLLDIYPCHITLTQKEVNKGEDILNKIGIPLNSKIVCLLIRDSAYLNSQIPNSNWDYHNYRDCDVDNYKLASEYLSDLGFYVVRMGRKVNKSFVSKKANIFDYANSKWASDFMDIYLGFKCTFCISSGSGWDAVPAWIFRKPTIFTNLVPFGHLPTYSDKFLLTTKRNFSTMLKRELTISEVFGLGVSNFCHTSSYKINQINLIENTPEEIKDVVIEMLQYLNGVNTESEKKMFLSQRFWNLYSVLINSHDSHNLLHGKFKSRFSRTYLINNQQWIN
jgi:putative glycosyltransferase (TIGR04372 family)